eukprot:scpid73002/ scgid33384/ MFS-type transporter SLC18B1; Solute carrier family 18 member B1
MTDKTGFSDAGAHDGTNLLGPSERSDGTPCTQSQTEDDFKSTGEHRLPARRGLTVALLWLSVAAGCLQNVFGPFFFKDALAKNPQSGPGYHTAVGAVFSIGNLSSLVALPLCTRVLRDIGSKQLLVIASFTRAAASIIFSPLNGIADWRVFLAYSYIIRFIHGLAFLCITIPTMTYLTRLYPENLGFVNSCLVTSLSLGHSIGTLLSGALYDVGGFNLPFIVTGAIAFLVSAGVAVFLVDSDKLEKEEQKQPEKTGNAREAAAVAETHLGTFAVLRVPWALYLLFLAIAATFAYSALEAVLSREMSLRLGVSTTVIGVALSFLFIQGALFGPIGGKLLDKGIDRNVTFSVGLVLMGLGCLLVGPASFLHLPHSLPLVIVSLFVFGVGRIISVMTVHVALAEHLRDIGVGTVVETRVPVSGLTRVFLSIGFMCGPLVVSPLVAVLGFQAAFTGLGLVYVFLAGPLLLKAAAGSRILERLMACICTLYRNRVDVNDSKTQQPIDDITELQPLKH